MADRDPRRGLDAVLTWARGEDYFGHSKFDAFNSPVVRAAVPNIRLLRAVVAALWARSPVNPRPLLRTRKFRNPKGVALFAVSYLRRYRIFGDSADLEEAKRLLRWLEANIARGYSGPCWGYDHDWYGLHFVAPKDSPNIIVTGNVAYAFTEAYEVTGDGAYLEVARGVVRFLLEDLGCSVDTPEMRNIGYIPGNVWGVININGIAASILSRVGRYTGDGALTAEARRLIAFLVDKQTDDGAWHYAWPAKSSNVAHDNYHTGNVLDWLMDYRRYAGDDRFEEATRRGLDFFAEHLFEADGLPKWRSDRTYPADAHGAGQAAVTFSKAAVELDGRYLDDARRVAGWALRHLQHPDGYFHYQKGRFVTKRYTLMRWCNAWMAFGLSSVLLAESELGGQ
ncbi:MAG: hypothetical protein AAGF23_06930 [Acidobacteriota bacterium]